MADVRDRILDAAVMALSEGGALTLDSAARSAGMTKPGLMYHFPTKRHLMLALVDHVAGSWDRRIAHYLGAAPEMSGPADRMRAYLDFALSDTVEPTDLVMFSDARLRVELAARWTELTERWIEVPDDLPPPIRARLLLVRLAAEGIWYAAASAVHPLSRTDASHVRALAETLLENA